MKTVLGPSYSSVYPVAASIAEPCALPGFDLLNEAVGYLKEKINSGQNFSLKSIECRVVYRLLSYSGIPTVINTISLILSFVLTVLSVPFCCCKPGKEINAWSWKCTKGSFANVIQSLFDITSDIRRISCYCCCPRDSVWRAV